MSLSLSLCVCVFVCVCLCVCECVCVCLCIFPRAICCFVPLKVMVGTFSEDEATFKRRRAVEIKHGRIVIFSDLSKWAKKLKQ